MTNPQKLSECADMTEEKFQECLGRVDMKAFIENPTQALTDAGVTLKKGVTLKFVDTEAEADVLPENVFPLILQKNSGGLTLDSLDKVVGGEGQYAQGMRKALADAQARNKQQEERDKGFIEANKGWD